MARRALIGIGLAVTVVAAAGLGVYLVRAGLDKADKLASVLGLFVAVAGLALTAYGLVADRARADDQRHHDVHSRVEAVLEGLAREQMRQWREELVMRRVQGRLLLPVTCRAAQPDLFDHWANIRGPADDAPLDLDGDVVDLDQVLTRVSSRRLVILGTPGAGKSVAALRLALRLLEERDAHDRLPVVLPVASWDARKTGLWRWVAERLTTEHPELAASTGAGTTLADEVARPERLLLVLDGFDEIPGPRRPAALTALNEGVDEHSHFVLTSRTEEYRRAVHAVDVLRAAPAVELRPLSVPEVVEYLRTSTRRTTQDGSGLWSRVIACLQDGTSAHAQRLRAVLVSPLMLGLARSVYASADTNPDELLDAAALPTRARIEGHLLGRLVPAAYSPPPDVGPPPRWRAKDAERWLRGLAGDAVRGDAPGGELAWWRVYRRQTAAATAGAVVIVYAAAVALTAALPLHGKVRWLGVSCPFWVALALAGALPLAVALTDVHLAEPAPVRLSLRSRLPGITARTVAGAAGVGLAWLSTMPTSKDPYPAGFPVPFALVLAVFFVVRATPTAATDVTAGTPRALLRTDRASALTTAFNLAVAGPRRWCLEALVLLPIPLLVTWQDHAGAGRNGAAAWAAAGGAAAALTFLYGLTASAWGRFTIARVLLVATRRLPWRSLSFLEDARNRGVLRLSGGAYRFRHARLLDHLAGPGASPVEASSWSSALPAQWPAPLLAGAVLAAAAVSLTGTIGRMARPSGPYLPTPSACSLLDAPALTAALGGVPTRDLDPPVDGGMFDTHTADRALTWCSWHTANGSRLGLATLTAASTPSLNASDVAVQDFAGEMNDPGGHPDVDPAARPCDWRHERVGLVPSEADANHWESIVLLCGNVLLDVEYRPAATIRPTAGTYSTAQRLLRVATTKALRPVSG
ncbi:NACHT domain-containing protein [Actinoallomurus soli]|uniref:NACHT domain-containing protein n=1 Tax=Actinoallomurus soli TaxID=2952535 RepID=UPI002093F9CF|nr:NACHT domain-containing protein [Actinoallomurus soli]MCO5974784.1 NACHT domain-containing protein [Actinoallomurus soli]